MRHHLKTLWLVTCLLAGTTLAWSQTPPPNRWESEIAAFAASDKTNAPPTNAVLFVGSSSIRLWKNLAHDFPEVKVINRGFGGSQISDSVELADRLVFPYQPRLIVFYAGGNDINAGKSAQQVFNDFEVFVTRVHSQLPRTRIAYISIAPNPARWAQIDSVRTANDLIKDYTSKHKNLDFINVFPAMLAEDGKPKPDIFQEDRLHMNRKGYEIWKEIVRQHLHQ